MKSQKKASKKRVGAKRSVTSAAKKRAVASKPKRAQVAAAAPEGARTTGLARAPILAQPVPPSPRLPEAQTPEPALSAPAPTPARIRKPVDLPPILLEGDTPSPPAPSGPGERFVLGPEVPEAPALVTPPLAALPEAYGSGLLFLTARDPHWLYATWDLTAEQQQHYNALSRDGHLTVRTYVEAVSGQPAVVTPVHPESKSWFIEVRQGGTVYACELGYRDREDQWHRVAMSSPSRTPPEAPSQETRIEFATVPSEISLRQLVATVQEAIEKAAPTQVQAAPPLAQPESLVVPATVEPKVIIGVPTSAPIDVSAGSVLPPPPEASAPPLTPYHEQPLPPAPAQEHRPISQPTLPEIVHRAVRDQVPLIEAVQQLRATGWTGLPEMQAPPPRDWTPEEIQLFTELNEIESTRRFSMGSLEIEELLRRHLRQEISSRALPVAPSGEAGRTAPEIPGPDISSPQGPEQQAPGERPPFWFNINAELVIYGATEPNARVTVDRHEIRLRPDGTFSCRFSLPDGQYPLLFKAVSNDGHQSRSTHLEFSRSTQHRDEVGVHPQDARLKSPTAAHFG